MTELWPKSKDSNMLFVSIYGRWRTLNGEQEIENAPNCQTWRVRSNYSKIESLIHVSWPCSQLERSISQTDCSSLEHPFVTRLKHGITNVVGHKSLKEPRTVSGYVVKSRLIFNLTRIALVLFQRRPTTQASSSIVVEVRINHHKNRPSSQKFPPQQDWPTGNHPRHISPTKRLSKT